MRGAQTCRSWIRVLLLATLAGVLTATRQAGAVPRSELEESYVQEALHEHGLEEDLHPEGKVIEAVIVRSFDVFDRRDPVPDFINIFHGTSRTAMVERELLQPVGAIFDRSKIEESERNLRALRQISLANIVVTKGTKPGAIRLLMVTKDVWSLRLNSDFAIGKNGTEYLVLNPAEENLAGTHTSIGVHYRYERYREAFGIRFILPRIANSRFSSAIDSKLIIGRETGQVEGSAGSFIYALPLFARQAQFGVGVSFEWLTEITRLSRNNELLSVPVESNNGTETVPWMYTSETMGGQLAVTRSFGRNDKYDLKFGLDMARRRYRADFLAADPALRAAFEASPYMPVADVLLRPFFTLNAYSARFHRVLSLDSLGIQEDFRVGHDVTLSIWGAAEALGSTRTVMGVSSTVGYTGKWESGLWGIKAANSISLSAIDKSDGLASVTARVTTPWLGFGRVHLSVFGATRYLNYRRIPPYFLGGNGRLRGYGSNQFAGRDILVANLEVRSGSIDILSAQVGVAAFYDVGTAEDDLFKATYHHSVGPGLRIMFPQADRLVLRADWGFPLGDAKTATWPGAFFLTFGQVAER